MHGPDVMPSQQPPACEEDCADDGEDKGPGRQEQAEDHTGRIIPRLSELHVDDEAGGTEDQKKGNAREPLKPGALPAVQQHHQTGLVYWLVLPSHLAGPPGHPRAEAYHAETEKGTSDFSLSVDCIDFDPAVDDLIHKLSFTQRGSNG